MTENFLEINSSMKKDRIFKILIFFIFLFFLVLILFNQSQAEDLNYKIEDSYIEIQQEVDSQIIPLIRKENNREEISGNFRIEDDYLISDLPENEFLEKFPQLNSGFKDLKIKIEVDQPLFKKENFYQRRSFSEKLKNFFSNEQLPEYRLTKKIQDSTEKLETNAKFSDLNLKTIYEEKEGKIKQSLLLENNSDKEINLQMSFIHSITAESISFAGRDYKISGNPQFLSPESGSSISFRSVDNFNQRFIYDFSDLMNFNSEVWVFKEKSENKLLIKTPLSVSSNSSLVLDPTYMVDTAARASSTAYGWQRKTWHDGSRYWVSFWSDSDNRIEFWYSTTSEEGSRWSENTNARISLDSPDFSLDCDATYCFIIYASGTNAIVNKPDPAGRPYPARDFSWNSSPKIIATTSLGTTKRVHLSKSSGGYLFASYVAESITNNFYAIKSSNPNDIASWDSATALDQASVVFHGLTAPCDNSGSMLAVFVNSQKIKSKKYTTLFGWSSSSTTVDYTDGTGFDENISAVYDTTDYDVHLLYNASNTNDSVVSYEKYDTSAATWGSRIDFTSSSAFFTDDYVSISADESDVLYAFWVHADGSSFPTVYYVKYSTSASPYTSWTSAQTLSSTTSNAYGWLTSNYRPDASAENDIFVEWTQATGSSYYIAFSKIDGYTANSAPTVGTVILNSGNAITLTENATTVISATTTVSDANTYSDIASVEGTIYRSGVGSSCTADDNNCYEISSCATSSCSGNSCTATCQANIWFHADPTDAGPYSHDEWIANIKAVDKQNASSSADSNGVRMNTLQSLDLSYLYERYNSGDTNYSAVGGTTWVAQTFTIGDTGTNIDHSILNVKLKLGRQGSPGADSVLGVRETDENGFPIRDGNDLVSVTFNGNNLPTSEQWYNFSLPSYQLSSSTKYALVLRAPNGNVLTNFLKWYYDDDSPSYNGGLGYISDDSGERWSENAETDYMFEEFGSGGINYGSLNPGQNTGTLNRQNLLLATGNAAIDVYLYGDNLATGSYSIPVNKQEYATSALNYGSGTQATSSTSTTVEVDLGKPVSHYYSTSMDDIYWGMGISTNTMPGIYAGTNTFEAKAD